MTTTQPETFAVEWYTVAYGIQKHIFIAHDEAASFAREIAKEGQWVRASFEYADDEPSTVPAEATLSIAENIGPGPNSIAYLSITGTPEAVATVTPAEIETLRCFLASEDGGALRIMARWLSGTRELTLRLGGAHHDMDHEPNDDGSESRYCVFCGLDYPWSVRCSRNREGLV